MKNPIMTSRYFRISVTEQCNLGCYFCHNEGQERRHAKRARTLSATDIVFASNAAYTFGFRKFKLTGGEPLLRQDIGEIISGIGALGELDLSMITNGLRLEAMAGTLKEAGLPRLNVSLYTLNADKFAAENRGSVAKLQAIRRGIDKAVGIGYRNIKLNYVYHGPKDDADFAEVCDFASKRELAVVLLPILPINLRAEDKTQSLMDVKSMLNRLGIAAERAVMDGEGIRKRLITLENGATVLLREEELQEKLPYGHCMRCAKRNECREGIFPVRLSADGLLRPCLADGIAPIDMFEPIKDRDAIGLVNGFLAIRKFMARRKEINILRAA